MTGRAYYAHNGQVFAAGRVPLSEDQTVELLRIYEAEAIATPCERERSAALRLGVELILARMVAKLQQRGQALRNAA